MIFIRVDEGVSPKSAEFAKEIGIPQGVVFDTPRGLDQLGVGDTDWMTIHSRRGGPRDRRAAFSADNFTDPERALAEALKVTLFSTPRGYWRPLKRLGQMAYFLRWMPRIIELTKSAPPGSQFRLPAHFNSDADLKPLPRITEKQVVRPGRPRAPRAIAPVPLLDRAT